MPARGYEFYLRVFNSISHDMRYRVEHSKVKFVSTRGHVHVISSKYITIEGKN